MNRSRFHLVLAGVIWAVLALLTAAGFATSVIAGVYHDM
jgi:hypothetical protein